MWLDGWSLSTCRSSSNHSQVQTLTHTSSLLIHACMCIIAVINIYIRIYFYGHLSSRMIISDNNVTGRDLAEINMQLLGM